MSATRSPRRRFLWGLALRRRTPGSHGSGEGGFYLVRGDPLFRIERTLGLLEDDSLRVLPRALTCAAVAWVPLACWALWEGRFFSGDGFEPLASQFAIHVRYLLAVPLMILCESRAETVLAAVLGGFISSGVITSASAARFSETLERVMRLRDSPTPWIGISLLIACAIWWRTGAIFQEHELQWAIVQEGGVRRVGFGGVWLALVSSPMFLALLLAWVWRLILLVILFRGISKLPLDLVATHPDRVGGLGFIKRLPRAFSGFLLAVSSVLAADCGHDIYFHSQPLQQIGMQLGILTLICMTLLLLPIVMFCVPLANFRHESLFEYGKLVGRHGRLVRDRWVKGEAPGGDPLLDANEIGPVADTLSMFGAVRDLRPIPFGRDTLLAVILPLALPFVPVALSQAPIEQVALQLLKTLL